MLLQWLTAILLCTALVDTPIELPPTSLYWLQCKDYLTFHLYWSTHNYYPDDGTGRCTLLNIGNFINVKDLSTLSLLQRSIDCEEREKPFFPHLLSSQSLSWLIVEKWKEILRKVKKVKVKWFKFWNEMKSSPSAQSPCWCPAAPCHRFLGQVSCIIQTWNETWKTGWIKDVKLISCDSSLSQSVIFL